MKSEKGLHINVQYILYRFTTAVHVAEFTTNCHLHPDESGDDRPGADFTKPYVGCATSVCSASYQNIAYSYATLPICCPSTLMQLHKGLWNWPKACNLDFAQEKI
jgi:hypothetical protein